MWLSSGQALGKEIVAPLQYEGSMDSALFEHWFESYFKNTGIELSFFHHTAQSLTKLKTSGLG